MIILRIILVTKNIDSNDNDFKNNIGNDGNHKTKPIVIEKITA